MELSNIYWKNPLWLWLTVTGVALLLTAIIQVGKGLTVRKFKRLAKDTDTVVDDIAILILAKTRLYSVFILSCYIASKFLTMPPQALTASKYIMVVIIALQIVVWGNSLIDFWLRNQSGSSELVGKSAFGLLGFVARLGLWSLVLLITLSNLGVNITAIITGLGVGGIAVALASQKILGDFFSSFIIVFDKPFEVGDFVVIGDYKGTIERIGVKTTRIRSLTGEQIVLPNSDIIDSRLRNFKRMEERRVSFRIGVEYSTPADKLEQITTIIKEVVSRQPEVRYGFSFFAEYGESSLLFETVYFVLSGDYDLYTNTHQAINFELFRRFEEEQIRFAFPTRTLHLINQV
ncbi:MAG: mechanosensitive ion channel family protein [bacterium]|nr:mechanosensitive ion channel family protein [bacterium]